MVKPTRPRCPSPTTHPSLRWDTFISVRTYVYVRVTVRVAGRCAAARHARVVCPARFVLCNYGTFSSVRFGLWTVPTTRTVRGSSEHAPSSQSLDTSLNHSQNSTEFSGATVSALASLGPALVADADATQRCHFSVSNIRTWFLRRCVGYGESHTMSLSHSRSAKVCSRPRKEPESPIRERSSRTLARTGPHGAAVACAQTASNHSI